MWNAALGGQSNLTPCPEANEIDVRAEVSRLSTANRGVAGSNPAALVIRRVAQG